MSDRTIEGSMIEIQRCERTYCFISKKGGLFNIEKREVRSIFDVEFLWEFEEPVPAVCDKKHFRHEDRDTRIATTFEGMCTKVDLRPNGKYFVTFAMTNRLAEEFC